MHAKIKMIKYSDGDILLGKLPMEIVLELKYASNTSQKTISNLPFQF